MSRFCTIPKLPVPNFLGFSVQHLIARHNIESSATDTMPSSGVPARLHKRVRFWWSTILFPQTQMDDAEQKSGFTTRDQLFQFFVLLVISCAFFLSKLSSPLLEPEEARYAEIPRQMLESRSYLTPVLHNEIYLHKPPLLYWLTMLFYAILGVDDWVARCVPGCAGITTVLLCYLFTRKITNSWSAFIGSLILCLSMRYVYLARMINTDSVLSLCVVTALLSGYLAQVTRRRSNTAWIVSAMMCGLAILAKGPVALILVCLPLMLIQFLQNNTNKVSWYKYFLVSGLIALPWYFFIALTQWNALMSFVWIHNIQRYVDPLDHAEPFWYFLPSIVMAMFPWILIIPGLFVRLTRNTEIAKNRRHPFLGFSLLAALVCIGFFSASGCKRPAYILPAFPFLALAVGNILSCQLPWRRLSIASWMNIKAPHWKGWIAEQLIVAYLLIGSSVALAAVVCKLWRVEEGLIVAWLLLMSAYVIFRLGKQISAHFKWILFVSLAFSLQLGAICFLLPDYNRKYALRGSIRRYVELCHEQKLRVYSFPRQWDSISFYLQKDVNYFRDNELQQLYERLQSESALVVLKRGSAEREFLSNLPIELEFIPFPDQRQKTVVGLVQPRLLSPNSKLARHGD